jgi:hypothetical protein
MLQFHSPSLEPRTERVALIQGCDPRTQSRYREHHTGLIEVRIMRRASDTDFGADSGYRWASWSSHKVSAVRVDGLILQARVELGARAIPGLYDLDATFEVLGTSVQLSAVELGQMNRTIQRVDRRLQTHKRSGSQLDTLIAIKDALKALGITQLAFYRNDIARGDLSNPSAFIETSMREALPRLDAIVKRIQHGTDVQA